MTTSLLFIREQNPRSSEVLTQNLRSPFILCASVLKCRAIGSLNLSPPLTRLPCHQEPCLDIPKTFDMYTLLYRSCLSGWKASGARAPSHFLFLVYVSCIFQMAKLHTLYRAWSQILCENGFVGVWQIGCRRACMYIVHAASFLSRISEEGSKVDFVSEKMLELLFTALLTSLRCHDQHSSDSYLCQ